MTATTAVPHAQTSISALAPGVARAILLAVITIAFLAGCHFTGGPAAAAHAGPALARLLRFMAVVKAGIALAACAAVLWRLGAAITLPWFTAYAVSAAAMAAGPGLIWGMAHVAPGALLLHGGLIATVLLVWRDPAVASRLAHMVAAKRAR
jgi:hypothetical protein